MGARHFKQMYNDALDVDRCAIHTALMMTMLRPASTPKSLKEQLGEDWQGVPKDQIMDLARTLQPLDTEFSERMKTMLLNGTLVAYMHDHHGRLHKVRDPDVIDFDDPIPSEEDFYKLVEVYLADEKVSSGDSN